MKQIACIHTVASVIDSFTAQLRQGIPGDYLIHTMYDDFLATDPARTGVFSEVNVQRLGLDMEAMSLTGADVIVVTCSTLSPAVRRLRDRFTIPVVAIDDAMARAAVAAGSRITILATANSTVEPTNGTIRAAARERGMEVELTTICNEDAIRALKSGDKATHDRMVLEMADQVAPDCEVIVLAQASMAHMEKAVAERRGIPTFSSPALCVEQLRKLVEE